MSAIQEQAVQMICIGHIKKWEDGEYGKGRKQNGI